MHSNLLHIFYYLFFLFCIQKVEVRVPNIHASLEPLVRKRTVSQLVSAQTVAPTTTQFVALTECRIRTTVDSDWRHVQLMPPFKWCTTGSAVSVNYCLMSTVNIYIHTSLCVYLLMYVYTAKQRCKKICNKKHISHVLSSFLDFCANLYCDSLCHFLFSIL